MGRTGDLHMQERMADEASKIKVVKKKVFLDGIEEHIHQAVFNILKKNHVRQNEINIYIPSAIQNYIMQYCRHLDKPPYYGSNADEHSGRRELTSFCSYAVLEGYESNIIVVAVQDGDIKGIKPIKRTVGLG